MKVALDTQTYKAKANNIFRKATVLWFDELSRQIACGALWGTKCKNREKVM